MIDSVNITITKKPIIIYGGAFNPPTNAHIQIAEACADLACQLGGEFWLLPSSSRPDKTITTGREMRIKYMEEFQKIVQKRGVTVRVCWDEFDRSVPTQTIDTIDAFTNVHPGRTFYWVFGADSIQTMLKWHGGRYIFEKVEKVIIPREGYKLDYLPPKSTLLTVAPQPVSSTEVREGLAKGRSVCGLVPSQIASLLGATC